MKRGAAKFTFSLSLHKAVGIVFLVPLLVISFTRDRVAFPNLKGWFENVTPAERGIELSHPPEAGGAVGEAGGTRADRARPVQRILEDEYPEPGGCRWSCRPMTKTSAASSPRG